MSLKGLKFHVEPDWFYEGELTKPDFGRPDQYMGKIVEWVKGCPYPQTYGCYALWKITHQQKRIDVMEKMMEVMFEEIVELKALLRTPVVATEVLSFKCGKCKHLCYDDECPCNIV